MPSHSVAEEHLERLQSKQIFDRPSHRRGSDHFLQLHKDIAVLGLSESQSRRIASVPIGWLGSPNPNGITWRFSDGSEVVTLSSGLFHLFYMAPKALCSLFKFENSPFGKSQRQVDFLDVAESFFDAILHFRTNCLFVPEKKSLIRTDVDDYGSLYGFANLDMVRLLILGQTVFVLSHEFAHIILGHVGERKKAVHENIGFDISLDNVDVVFRNWDEEYAADRLGLQISFRSFKRAGPDRLEVRYLDDIWLAILESSAYLFFLTIQLADILPECPFDKGLSLHFPVPKSLLSDHPHPALRYAALLEGIDNPATEELLLAYRDIAERLVAEAKKGRLCRYIKHRRKELSRTGIDLI